MIIGFFCPALLLRKRFEYIFPLGGNELLNRRALSISSAERLVVKWVSFYERIFPWLSLISFIKKWGDALKKKQSPPIP